MVMYMFVDIMNGEKLNGTKTELYSEISPRLSIDKLSGTNLSVGFIKEFFLATQLNAGNNYIAYLGGFGVDLDIPWFVYFSLNAYYKYETIHNVEKNTMLQITPAYKTVSWYNFHFEGFLDYTPRSINTQNQFLYHFGKGFYGGAEWLYYHYNYNNKKTQTNVWQAMLKYQF